MKFHIGETLTPAGNLLPLAKAGAELGYNGYCVSDSICYPKYSDTSYSYTDDGGRDFIENKDVIESFVLAAAIGVSNPSLEVTTSVLKLPVRQPVYAAKLATSVHAITEGRFNLGVGLSVWPEDYAVMGVDYADRGRRLDECIEIVRGLSKGGYFAFHGRHYGIPEIRMNPAAPDLPILIGGHSDAALRRAARNDGWSSAGSTASELETMIAKLNTFRQEEQRQSSMPFRIFETVPGQLDYDAVRRKEELGVTDVILYFRNIYVREQDTENVAEKIGRFEKFANDVMRRIV